MKLAFILTGGLHPSGRYEVIPAWIGLLASLARNNEVHAFVMRHLREAATYSLRDVTVHDLGRPGGHGVVGRWSEWRALGAALAGTERFDVFHGYWADPGGLLAALAGRRFGVPSVVTCDGGEFVALEDIDYGLQRTVRGRTLVSTACEFTSCVHVATEYMERLAADHGYNIVRLPIGVELACFPLNRSRPEGPPWKLLTVASLNRVKDHATLVEAIAIVSRNLDVHLDLVGEDTLDGALRSHVARLGIAGRVTFHGYRPFDELPPFYQAAHLYVQSSRHEAAGVAVLEAAASGLPIVGTRVGYVADWDGESAVAVEPGNPMALAHAIVETLGNPDVRERIATNARAFVVAHDVHWTARALKKLYASLVKDQSTDAADSPDSPDSPDSTG